MWMLFPISSFVQVMVSPDSRKALAIIPILLHIPPIRKEHIIRFWVMASLTVRISFGNQLVVGGIHRAPAHI